MRTLIIAAAFMFLVGVPSLTGVDLSLSGPMTPPLEMPQFGGGGGP